MRLKAGGKRQRLRGEYEESCSSSILMREEGLKVYYCRKYFSINILRKFSGNISNFKSARSLLSTLFVRAARALLCPSSLKLGGRWHK